MQSSVSNPTSIASRVMLTLVALACLYLWCGATALAGVVPSFQGLGDLPGGDFASTAQGVSADGSVVVGGSVTLPQSQAFRWTLVDGMSSLGSFPGGDGHSVALSASADGAVIVGSGNSALGREAFRWTSSGGMVNIGHLPGGGVNATGVAVSNDGSVIAGHSESDAPLEAFRWTAGGGMVGLGFLPGPNRQTQTTDISADGSVIVGIGINANSRPEAFRWTEAGGLMGLGDVTGATTISAEGSVIAGSIGLQAARWEGGVWTGLGMLSGADLSFAAAISADGSVIVGDSLTASIPEAFIWDGNNGMRRLHDVLVGGLGLDLTGWTLSSATDISADGRTIVGWGANPSGFTEGWIATIPEPSTLFLLTLGGLAMTRHRRRVGAASRWSCDRSAPRRTSISQDSDKSGQLLLRHRISEHIWIMRRSNSPAVCNVVGFGGQDKSKISQR